MIKHSFIRSSKKSRVGFTTSLHPSPNKQYQYQHSHCNPRLRQSLDFSNRPSSSCIKENIINQKSLKHLLDDSVQQSKYKSSYDLNSLNKDNQLNSFKNKLIELQIKMGNTKGLQQRLSQVEQKMIIYERQRLQTKQLCKTEQIRSVYSRKDKQFQIMDSEIQQQLSLASLKGNNQISVYPQQLIKKQIQQILSSKVIPNNNINRVQNSIFKLQKQIRQIKQREINLIQIIEKYHDQSSKQLKTTTLSLKKQFSDILKYQITKNNQVFFKMKSNQKTIPEIISLKIQQITKQTQFSINSIRQKLSASIQQLNQKLNQNNHSLLNFQQEMQTMIEGVVEQFNTGLEQVKSQQSQLACISQSLMDIIKCLVKKSGISNKQYNKSIDIVDLIKSNIIDINKLKTQQSMINKEISNLKPPLSSSRRQLRIGLKNFGGQINQILSSLKGKMVQSTDEVEE